jgi:hypothetical protein
VATVTSISLLHLHPAGIVYVFGQAKLTSVLFLQALADIRVLVRAHCRARRCSNGAIILLGPVQIPVLRGPRVLGITAEGINFLIRLLTIRVQSRLTYRAERRDKTRP